MLRNRWALLTLAVGLIALVGGPALLQSGHTADPYSLVYSTSSNHSNPQALDGAEVSGSVYVVTTPDEGVDDVIFSFDGSYVWTEDNPPFDFAGGNRTDGKPWDTTRVADGPHTIKAELVLTDGTTSTIEASFTINNNGTIEPTPTATQQPVEPTTTSTDVPVEPTPTATATQETSSPSGAEPSAYGLVYSLNSNRSAPLTLEGATISGVIYTFTVPDEGVDDVHFLLNGNHVWTEKNGPFDFAGGSRTNGKPWDTSRVPDGAYTISAQLVMTDGMKTTIEASFTVNNNGTSEPMPTATQQPVEPTPTPTEELVEPTATPPSDDPTTEEPSGNAVRLVDSYVVHVQATGYDEFKYRPRQFTNGLIAPSHKGDKQVTNAGAYSGWDVLITRNSGGARVQSDNPWFTVRLTRKAQVAIVWQDKDAPPNWLASWPKGGTVSIGGVEKQVYLKTFNAGDFSLGSVWDGTGNGPYGRETYLVLFAEANGQPTPAPSVSAGKSIPTPNETCPTWVHDQYVTQGPDGRTYATWHPQIDPVYWCYFRHDHGTNPAHFGDGSYKPAFGYAAYHHGMNEPHAGFKVFVGDYAGYGEFLFVVHMGSGGTARYCARYHTVDFVLWNGSKIVAETYFLADFGKSVINRTSDPSHHTPFTPVACPNQADIGDSVGERHLPAASHDGLQIGYEGWRFDVSKSPMLGLQGGTVTFWTQDGMTICDDVNCAKTVPVPGNNDADHQIQDFFRFGVVSPAHAGTFYTDPMGAMLLDSGNPHAVRQYVAPGLNLTNWDAVEKCRDLDGWGRQLTCHVDNPRDGNDEREGSLDLSYYSSVGYLK